MTGVVNIIENSEMSCARRHMNHIGGALLALMILHLVVALTIYYMLAIQAGAHIGFYGISPAGVLKTVAQIKTAAAKVAIASPVAQLFATLIGNILPFIICARAVGVNRHQIFSRSEVSGSTTALFGIVALAASLFASVVVNLVSLLLKFGRLELTTPSINIPWKSPVGAVAMILAVVVAAPLTEEFICRGVLLNVFRRYGDIFAVVASSLVWALLHENLVQGLPVFAMGLFFGMLALKSHSIIPTVILHSLNNTLSLVESAAITQNTLFSRLGVSAMNFTVLVAAIVLVSVYYKSFSNVHDGENVRCGENVHCGNRHGFAVFFTCVPILIVVLICAAETLLSIKPM